MIVQPVVEPMDRFAALPVTELLQPPSCAQRTAKHRSWGLCPKQMGPDERADGRGISALVHDHGCDVQMGKN